MSQKNFRLKTIYYYGPSAVLNDETRPPTRVYTLYCGPAKLCRLNLMWYFFGISKVWQTWF